MDPSHCGQEILVITRIDFVQVDIWVHEIKNVVSRIEVVMIAKTTSKLRYWTFGFSLVSQVLVTFCIYAKTCHLFNTD